jgi:magnesium transporter
MISLYHRDGTVRTLSDLDRESLSPEDIWLDLDNPTREEVDFVERTTRLQMPSLEDLSEIEASSRVYVDNGALFMSAPLAHRSDTEQLVAAPIGFVLTQDRLVTIRFHPLVAFAAFAHTLSRPDAAYHTASALFAGLLEAIVDRLADVLELTAADLDRLSHRLFSLSPATGKRYRPSLEQESLRQALQRVGRAGDSSSQIRDALLGIARLIPFVAIHAADWVGPECKDELETLRHDVSSLADYDAHLLNKVSLLLDATLGLINVEQNNIIKVLTIVTVVGVPPTLIASMYGMNFHNMPEYDWAWGYPYGLTLIFLSTVLPIIWFKIRGWF